MALLADINVSVSMSIVISVILCELFSLVWYNDKMPWGNAYGNRFMLSAIVSDVGLCFLVQHLMSKYWGVSQWEDAMKLAVFLGLIYVCLDAPFAVDNGKSLVNFLFHAIHKVLLVFIITFSLVYFKDFKF